MLIIIILDLAGLVLGVVVGICQLGGKRPIILIIRRFDHYWGYIILCVNINEGLKVTTIERYPR